MLTIYFRTLRHFWRMNISRETQYRANFISLAIVGVIEAIIVILPMLLLYSFTEELAGWNQNETLALVGLFRAGLAIYLVVAGNGINMISADVNSGELDLWMIRPVHPQFLITFRYVSLPQLGNLVIGVAIFVTGFARAHASTSGTALLTAAIVFVCGLVLLTAAISAGSYLAFRATTVEGLPWMLHDIASMGQYPLSFYPAAVRVFLTGVMPVAFISTVPMNVLRGNLGWEVALGAVAFTAAALWLLRRWWDIAVRDYTSASS